VLGGQIIITVAFFPSLSIKVYLQETDGPELRAYLKKDSTRRKDVPLIFVLKMVP
jgi:hypothetical protein